MPARPGVAGVSEPGSAGERPLAQFTSIRLADDHRSGRLEAPDDLTVVGSRRDIALGAEGGWHSSNVDVVLDRDRNAQQRRRVAGRPPLIGAAASASADSVSTTRKAFNVGWLTSIARRERRTNSSDVTARVASW